MSPTPLLLSLLHSFTARTGLVAGAAAAAAYLAAGFVFDVAFGRPSPDQWAGTILFGLPILAILLGGAGAIAGLVVQFLVTRSRFAGPFTFRGGMWLVAIACVAAGLNGVRVGLRNEARNRPRVIESTGAIVRMAGALPADGVVAATVFGSFVPPSMLATLRWQGASLQVTGDSDTVTLRLGDRQIDTVDLNAMGLDDVTLVVAATATLDSSGEWLAVVLRLRATGRRELLLIYAPSGALAHKELLERTIAPGRPVLFTKGRRGERQEFAVNAGQPLRFAAK